MSNQEYIKIEGAYENNLKGYSEEANHYIHRGLGFREIVVGIGYHCRQFTSGVE